MAGYDVMGLLRDYDEKQRSGGGDAPKENAAPSKENAAAWQPDRAEEIVDNAMGDASREKQIRDAAKLPDQEAQEKLLERAAARKLDEGRLKIDAPAYQKRAVAMMLNAMNLKNAQAVIAISNRENIRKGLGKDPGLQKAKAAVRGQMSTVAIPTVLLRYVQQEIGPLSGKASQNDAMAGFLYWYFGKPDGVAFASPDSANRVEEIVSNLDLNASPSKFNRASYNMSSSLLERLDEIRDRLDAVASWMQADMNYGLKSRMQDDKAYIALCYLILSQSALAPPLRPDQEARDIDLLAEGGVWDLMEGIDEAYDYYSNKNGREIYKAKHGMRPGRFSYSPGSGAAPSGDGGGSLYGSMPTRPDPEPVRRPIPIPDPEEPDEDYDNTEDYEGDDEEEYQDITVDPYDEFDLDGDMYGDTLALQRPDDDVQSSDRSAIDLMSSMRREAASQKNLEGFKKKLSRRQDPGDAGWTD